MGKIVKKVQDEKRGVLRRNEGDGNKSTRYPVYTTNRCRAGLVDAHELVRFRHLFAFTLQQCEPD